jgi:hypothetical protein
VSRSSGPCRAPRTGGDRFRWAGCQSRSGVPAATAWPPQTELVQKRRARYPLADLISNWPGKRKSPHARFRMRLRSQVLIA